MREVPDKYAFVHPGYHRFFPRDHHGEICNSCRRPFVQDKGWWGEQAAAFHRTTAQLLFLSRWARWDIQTAVAFLTTRVKGPGEDDWGKLKRALRYLNGTVELWVSLSMEDIGLI
jgi:hypothetical protein